MKIAALLLSLGSVAAFAPSQPSQSSFALRAEAETADAAVPAEEDAVEATISAVPPAFRDFKDEIGVVAPVSFQFFRRFFFHSAIEKLIYFRSFLYNTVAWSVGSIGLDQARCCWKQAIHLVP